ncbi:MAG TPA: glycerol-3-phosphate dehydrogenase/oxidase [Candidatus Saccharimonadales bacterium]|jgi:glycerol-3-phosphate dehydrogenase|nr:glycerol-3-phosphate dehydrogenase/oxidase [Candidatus Saccharimonadales bacterium]
MLRGPERNSLAGQQFDVLIIGGGINGVAIARECSMAGRRVLIVDQRDFASGTTSRSTRIIHGGLRYLEHGEIALVRESLRERDRLLQQSPYLVKPLRFLLALQGNQKSFTRSSQAIRAGLWLYHRWAGRPWRTARSAYGFERQLDSGNPWSFYAYEDAQCEFPERMAAEWLRESIAAGAVARNYTRLLQIEHRNGTATGVRLRDTLSSEEFRVSAAQIVNATGPWVDSVASAAGLDAQKMVGGIKGSHIVLPRFTGMPVEAFFTEAPDGRLIFVIPWNEQILVGTTEVADSGNPEDARPTPEEVDYLMAGFQRFFPQSGLSHSDIRYSFSGVRPLPASPGKSAAAVTRKHIIHDHTPEGAAGLISIIGGKLTTAASLARETARKLGLHVPEPGKVIGMAPAGEVEATLRQWAHLVASKAGIPEANAQAIAAWHGRHAMAIASTAAHDEALRAPLCSHSHHIVAEAVEAIQHECAVTLGDILLRRVPVALGPCWSEACGSEAAHRIGHAMGWSEEKINRELEQFEEEREGFLHPSERNEAASKTFETQRNRGSRGSFGS